jgi:DNA-binding response OmpR family regulator
MSIGAIDVDLKALLVLVDGKPVELTPVEYRLLLALIEADRKVVSRDRLLQQVWGAERIVTPRTVDTSMHRLRVKLGVAGAQIQSIRGFGYRLDE